MNQACESRPFLFEDNNMKKSTLKWKFDFEEFTWYEFGYGDSKDKQYIFVVNSSQVYSFHVDERINYISKMSITNLNNFDESYYDYFEEYQFDKILQRENIVNKIFLSSL